MAFSVSKEKRHNVTPLRPSKLPLNCQYHVSPGLGGSRRWLPRTLSNGYFTAAKTPIKAPIMYTQVICLFCFST